MTFILTGFVFPVSLCSPFSYSITAVLVSACGPFSCTNIVVLDYLCGPFPCTATVVPNSLRGPFSCISATLLLYASHSHVRVLSLILYAVRSHLRILLSKFSMRSLFMFEYWALFSTRPVLIFEYWPSLLTRSFHMYEHCVHRFSMRSVFIYKHYCPISLCDPLSCGITVVFVPLCGPFPYTSVVSVFYAVRSQVRVRYPCVFLLPHIAAESVQTHGYWQWSFLPPQAPFCTWILSMYPPQICTAWTRAT